MKIKCEKHPKYKGNKIPKNECVDCLQIYFNLKNAKAPTSPPPQIIKSKKHKKPRYKKDYKDDE